MKKLFTAVAATLLLVGLQSQALAGAQQEKMKSCNAEAKTKELKGDERKAFMKECLSSKKEGASSAKSEQQTKMKTCNADAKSKSLKGDERKAFMKECLSATPAG